MKLRLLLLSVVLTCSSAAAAETRYAGQPLVFWLDELKSSDPLIREEAILVLTEAGPAAREAVPRLEALTKDEHRRVRLRAGLALFSIAGRKKPAIAALTEAIRDPTTPDRLELLRTLTAFGPDAASSASAVLDLAGDADPILATQAVQMLPKLGPGIAALLAAELEQKDMRRRRHASEALAQMGASSGDARAALLRGLDADDRLVRTACARALWGQGQTTETVIAVLREAARTGDNAQRRRILGTVGYGHRSKRGVAILKELLRGGELLCRVQAAARLQDIDPQPETVLPIYLEGLKIGQLGTRLEAAKGLTRLGPAARPALPALIEQLKAPDGPFLSDVHNALAAIGAPAVPPLIELLTRDKADPRVSAAVMNILARIGAPVVPAVLPLLSHAAAPTRAAGCRVLVLLGPAAKEAVPQLTLLLKDHDLRIRRDAVTALGRIGPAARPATRALMELTRDPILDLRTGSLKALEQIQADPKLVRPLAVKALEDKNAFIRARAVSLLWHVAPKDADLMPHILELLRQPLGRSEMLELLGEMGPEAGAAVPALAKLLANRDRVLRGQVVQALEHIGATARPAVPALIDLLPGADAALRQTVVHALLTIGSDDSARIVPAVLETAKKDTMFTRTLCLRVLAQQGRRAAAAVPWLVDELHRPANNFTIDIANTLSAIDSERSRKEALPILREILKGHSWQRLPAAGALLRLEPDNKDALELLIESLEATEFAKRQPASQLLAAAGPAARAAVPALRRALRDPEVLVRINAADALYRIAGETETTVPVLIEALKPSPAGSYARQLAAEKLGDMGPAAKTALPVLRRLREEPDRFVRLGILAAIRKIEPPAAPPSPSKP